MVRRWRNPAPAALLAAALLAGTAAPARAAVAFEATVEPIEISFPETRELSYRLRMATGGREERFGVRVEQPGWDLRPGRAPPGSRSFPTASASHSLSRAPAASPRPSAPRDPSVMASAGAAAASGSSAPN
jgi:hypothetical protein